MRSLGVAALVCLASAGSASAKSSNPAFLGVGMHDANGHGSGPCTVDTITADSAASNAGLRPYDEFVAIDGAPIAACDALITAIQGHEPGDFVRVDVRRTGSVMTIRTQLLSREEVLRRRLVGQPVPTATLVRVDDKSVGELAPRGMTTVVGWFDKDCIGCDQVFGKVARWAAKSPVKRQITVLGATGGDLQKPLDQNLDNLKGFARGLDVPLLVADAATFQQFTISDKDRIHFMVVDCRGVVQFVAPVAPDGDDASAVLDELYAATEQAARRMK